MKLLPAALLLAAAVPALGAATGTVRRGDLVIHVKVTGTVVPDDVFRLKSTIDGRVESVITSSRAWHSAAEPLATLAYRELAAMIDARGSQNQNLMEDRWSRVYRPTPIRCPTACYVLKVYAKEHTWVKPQAVLFEAASQLKLIGRVRPEDAPLIRDGMTLTFWAVNDPTRKLTGKVTHFILDIQGERAAPGGTFTLNLTSGRFLDPGTDWEGDIIPLQKKDVLMVPTPALIVYDGVPYLPIRVSTGVTGSDFTQITTGVEEKREFLILDDSQLHGAQRHERTVRDAFELRRHEEGGSAQPAETEGATTVEHLPAAPSDKGYEGEDPYGDQ